MAGTLTIDTLKASSGVLATQNGMTGIAKAWVNFNGSTATPTIRGSFNVSSVTKITTGQYTITFATAMPSASYAVLGTFKTTDNNASGGNANSPMVWSYATGSVNVGANDGGSWVSPVNSNVAIFGA